MKVKELKELLNQFNDEDIVIMSKDGEGNGFSPLSDIEEGSYKAETTWYGEVGMRELTEEDIADINQIKNMGFDLINVIQMFMICDRDVDTTINLLLNN